MLSLSPDTLLAVDVIPSPNHGERRDGARPDAIVLHYTGMPDAQVALDRLCRPGTDVSAHYVVFEDGRIVQCVSEERRAWHAGEASWAGVSDINSCSIGIEIVNPGHDDGYPDFPLVQIDAVIALCGDILSRRQIRAERVLAHSDVAPARKRDPGEKFPWGRLHRAGVGHWVEPHGIVPGEVLGPGDSGDSVKTLQRTLRIYGYGLDPTGIYDATTELVVAAFQRHFRSLRVDGLADLSTVRTLTALQNALPVPMPPNCD